ncbi:ABC1 kinase family protein [Agilicoccus flavus]|uniref:ABC1 kinase family protein n=1 Tax=Agilicoccus flavus TaxID=2775968 RepID=UPI001CF6B6CD|nr:AarF/ABC1/UbiB kinase family protein [Agilicoccus flavus]
MSRVPRKAIVRTAKLATLPIGVAGRAAVGAGRRLGGAPADMVTAQLQERTAAQLFSVLGELKGGAMKVGQALSIVEAAMPEEVARPYRATLTKLQDSAPALPAATVHEVLARELGPRWRTKFADFDDAPAASASVGQVHRATWKDGRTVAVKVQYPGAREALVGDFTRLARVARMSASWLPGLDLGPLLEEFVDRVEDELDYAREAASQRTFAETFDGDPDVVVPAVVHQKGAVLITEWLDGTPLSRVIAEGTPAQRSRAGAAYLEFLLRGPHEARLLHADPHPGNFRMTDDGRIGVLDFGSVDPLPGGLPVPMGRLVSTAMAGEADALLAGLRAEGFVRPGVDVDADELLAFLVPFAEPLRTETFRFDRDWLRAQYVRLQDPRSTAFRTGIRLNLPPEYLLIHRVWVGGLGVLCQIGGEVPARGILDDWMPGADLPLLDGLDDPA